MAMETLSDLFEDQVKDLYSAENQLLKALPRMSKKASSATLKKAFDTHTKETERHVKRLTQICEMLKVKPGGKKCKAMEGLIEEGKEVISEKGRSPVIDAALVAAAQRVEHYEISAYGTARTLAENLDLTKAAGLLEQTLEEESATDEKLTQICESEILPAATMAEAEESEA